jgi:hypothetical protein
MRALLWLSRYNGACTGKDPSGGMSARAWKEHSPYRLPKMLLSAENVSWLSGRYSASIVAGPQHSIAPR